MASTWQGNDGWWYTSNSGIMYGPYPDQGQAQQRGAMDSGDYRPPAPQPAPAPQPTYQQPPPQQAPAPTPTTPAGPTTQQNSAKAKINAYLDELGLGSLGDRVWQWILNGMSEDEIYLEIRKTEEYKSRFQGMQQLVVKGRAISEREYISLEKAYTSLLRRAGLPIGFYDDPSDFAALIGGEVSPEEFGERLNSYSRLIYEADPSAKGFLQQYYGIGDNEILAYIIDPTRALPILQRQFLAAEESAAAVRAGFGALTKEEAEQIAAWGIDPQQAAGRFTQLGMDKELYNPLPGEAGIVGINRSQQIAGFLGGNADALKALERVRTWRKAQFEGGGGYATTKEGVVGVAASQT